MGRGESSSRRHGGGQSVVIPSDDNRLIGLVELIVSGGG